MKKSGPKGPRPNSAATFIRTLIKESWSDDIIRKKVRRKFPTFKLTSKAGKNVITWFRWQLRTQEVRG